MAADDPCGPAIDFDNTGCLRISGTSLFLFPAFPSVPSFLPSCLPLRYSFTRFFLQSEPVSFRNEGNEPVRIPDEINDETADYFFVTVLRTERGDVRILNREIGTMTFQRPLNYRELAPGREYSVTIPICLDEVDLEGWKQCSCELETSYYNQQGEGCFRGMLRATARLALQ